MEFTDLHTAYWFIKSHPEFNTKGRYRGPEIDVHVTKVCPKLNRIRDNKELNTKTQIWLELSVPLEHTDQEDIEKYGRWVGSHDWALDCGGDTYEEAVCTLANKVFEVYGGYENV